MRSQKVSEHILHLYMSFPSSFSFIKIFVWRTSTLRTCYAVSTSRSYWSNRRLSRGSAGQMTNLARCRLLHCSVQIKITSNDYKEGNFHKVSEHSASSSSTITDYIPQFFLLLHLHSSFLYWVLDWMQRSTVHCMNTHDTHWQWTNCSSIACNRNEIRASLALIHPLAYFTFLCAVCSGTCRLFQMENSRMLFIKRPYILSSTDMISLSLHLDSKNFMHAICIYLVKFYGTAPSGVRVSGFNLFARARTKSTKFSSNLCHLLFNIIQCLSILIWSYIHRVLPRFYRI